MNGYSIEKEHYHKEERRQFNPKRKSFFIREFFNKSGKTKFSLENLMTKKDKGFTDLICKPFIFFYFHC